VTVRWAGARGGGRHRLLAAAAAALLAACQASPVPPPASPSATPAPVAAAVQGLPACDPAGQVPCLRPDAFVSIPIEGTGLALTWSSLWASGRHDHPDWDAGTLGLGGMSLDAIEGYAPQAGVLVGGDGSWRMAAPVPAGSGETAVPTFDASLAYVFDSSGRHVRTVDGRLGTTLLTIAYDQAGRLSSVKGSVAGQPVGLTVQRSADGQPTALVGIDGGSVQVVLDPQGRLSALRDTAGHLTSLQWQTGGMLASETDPMGAVTRFDYDAYGRLATTTDPDGVVTHVTTTLSDTAYQVTQTTALGRTSTYRTSAGPGGISRTFTGPDGATTTGTEDPGGGRTVTFPDGTALAVSAVASSEWGVDAPVAATSVRTRPDGVTTHTTVSEALAPTGGLPYAVAGNVTTTVDGQAWVEAYDPSARTATLTGPAGQKAVETYDESGRLVSATGPAQAALAWAYDTNGRVASETVGSGTAARTTRYAYDASTGRITATRPDGSTTTTTMDALGNPVAWTAADGSTTVTNYDAAGHPIEVQPAGALGFTLGTSAAGRTTGFLPPSVGGDGAIETTSYNADGQPSSIAGPGARNIQQSFDAAGRLSGWTTSQGQATLAYAPGSGLLASATDPSGVATAYGYAGSTLSGLTWSGPVNGSVATAVDGLGRTTGETVDGGRTLALAYDAAGSLSGIGGVALTRDPATGLVTREVLGPVETDLAYDGADALARSTTKVSATVVLDRAYRRDALGRIASVTEISAAGTTTTRYTYDGADRLASVKVGGAAVETDAYDLAGDRTSVTTPSGTTRATYDDRQRLTAWGQATYSWKSAGALASIGSSAGTTSFAFDDLGRLTGVTLPDGRKVSYLVDADGRRVGREIGGALVAGYLYDPAGHVVAVTDGNGAVTEQFGYDDQGHLALVIRGGASYAVVTDQLAGPRLVVDSTTGAVVDAIAYDAWGRVTSESSPGFLPFGFAGGLRDPDTGLVHFGARDYDPVTGRWISSDPIRFAGGDPNLYRYVGGDPTSGVDPSGFCGIVSAGLGLSAFLLSGQLLRVPAALGFGLSGPPCPPPPPPPPPSGSGGTSICTGDACNFGRNIGCVGGSCGWGPSGFFCDAEICNGPGGQQCVGAVGAHCQLVFGDTHLETADGTHYDFQAAGEFIGARSPDGDVQVQVRQEPALGGASITFATAVAAGVAGDRLGVYAKEPSFLVVNGVPAPAPDLVERLPHGGTVERHGGTVTIDWPDGSRLTVIRVANTLNLAFAPSAAAAPTLRGLLGRADGNPADDLTGRDGAVLSTSDPGFATRLYSQFGNSWRVRAGESLFDYGPGESTATFAKLDIPTATATVATLPADKRAFAQGVCAAVGVRWQPLLDDCVLDVGETGDPAFAAAEVMLAGAGPSSAATPGGTPAPSPSPSAPSASPGPTASATPAPSSVGPRPLTLGEDAAGTISTTTQHDDFTFRAAAGEIVYGHAEGDCATGLQWVLLGPRGVLLGMGPGICQEIGRVVLPTAGTYTVRVRSDGTATGAYRFLVTAVPPTKVDAVAPGQSVMGSIGTAGEWHDYTFAAATGQKITVTAAGTCPGSLSWNLLRPDGSLLDFHPACGSMGPDAITVPGTYTLRVLGAGAATGTYGFSIGAAP
jgi:RHS repeat-associated protein